MVMNNKSIIKARKKIPKKSKKLFCGISSETQSHISAKKNQKKTTDLINIESEDGASDDDVEYYEKKPRLQKTANVRNLLPVKHKDGFVFRTEVVEDTIENEDSTIVSEHPEEKIRKLTLVERYAIQRKVLDDLKRKVALLCTSVVEDPENSISGLKELIAMLHDTRSLMIVSEKKILCVSLLHVFSDILPSYKIRPQGEKESKVKLKKETKKLLSYEHNLLRYYKKYIDYLCKLVQDMEAKKKQMNLSDAKRKAVHEIGVIAIKCLCELLSTRFSFNYFKNMCNIIVPLVAEGNDEISSICCQSFEKMFKSDKLGEASFDLVRQIVNFIKEKRFCVPACLLRSFLSLNLREAKVEKQKIDMNKGRKEWCNMSRKERRNKKKMKELEAELKEAQAYESVESVKKYHEQTLNKIFWVFFHVLKDARKLILLSPALEGLSKFAYLINLEFYDDLNAVLCGLMESGKLSDIDKLHGVYTLFTILAGQAESLHIDPHEIYCHMYQSLLKLSHYTDVQHFILSLKCLEFNILRKKKKISFSRILAFTKRVCTVSLQTPIHGTLSLLCSIRNILLNVKGSDILLDTEGTVGSGVYLPEIEDPEYCNTKSTALWELNLLKNHYNPFIRLYSQYLLHNCPNRGRLSLPMALEKSSPEDTLNLFADIAVRNKMDFLEESVEPPKKKFRSDDDFDDIEYEKNVDLELTWDNGTELDFSNIN